MIDVLRLVAGFVALVAGGELLVRGASGLAAVARVSPLVIGLTVVALGTSSPELAVCLQSAFAGRAEIAVGNVIGSNIFNVLLVLGLTATIAPLVVSSRVVRLDVPLMIGASFLIGFFALDGVVSRVEGLIAFGVAVAYTVWSIVESRREKAEVVDEFSREFAPKESPTLRRVVLLVVYVVSGLVLLAFGADWLVAGASAIARRLGTSDLVIGLTIVAAGTSLPEVVASVVATIRGERDIAVGNVVGSNLFNLLVVLGLGSAIVPGGMPVSQQALTFDLPIMIAVTAACLPIFFTGHRIDRWEGVLLLFYYVAYTTCLVLSSTSPELVSTFGVVLFGFVVPLTVVGLGISLWRCLRPSGP